MKTFKVKIKNFMIIKNADLEFRPGLTTIIGPSNNGKSTILTALQAMLYNQSMDQMIKQGEDSTSIGVQYDGNTILWKRNLSSGVKIVYKINKNILTKVGRQQPEELLEVLPFEDKPIASSKVRLNFINQGDSPLLVNATGSALYDFLSKSNQTEELNKVVKDMKEDIKELNHSKTQLEGAIEYLRGSLKEEKEEYDKIKSCDFTVMRILELDNKNMNINKLKELIDNTIEYNKEMKSLKGLYKEISLKEEIITNYMNKATDIKTKIEDLFNTVAYLEEQSSNVRLLTNEINSINTKLEDISINDLENRLQYLKELSLKVVKLQDILDKIYQIDNKKQVILDRLSVIEEEEKEVTKQLSSYKVCPLCNSSLEGYHEH